MSNFKALFNFKSLPELLEHFKDESTCIPFFEQIRWAGKPICPHCGHDKVYRTNRGYKCANKECYKKFTVKVGTIFEQSHIPLKIWFAAIYLTTAHKKGISSYQLGRDLNITQKTAWFLLHRIREMLTNKAPVMLGNNVCEIDETLVGGKEKNKHANKRTKGTQGRSLATKTVMFGIKERGGKVVALQVDNVKGKTLKPIIKATIKKGATISTDEYRGYNGLGKQFIHVRVNHKKGVYVDGIASTNGIENFWSIFKRGIIGIYHNVSHKHVNRYVNEFAARHNTRDINECERFEKFLGQADGRLTWKKLVC